MKSARALSLVAALAGLALGGCGLVEIALPKPFALSRTRVGSLPGSKSTKPEGFLPWAMTEPYLIVVTKETRELIVYQYGKPTHRYPVVLGRNSGRKRFEGDRRTPSGFYSVVKKRPHQRFFRFLDIDYPNADDVAQYEAAVADGIVPVSESGRVPKGPGRLVGIHGSDKEDLNQVGVNWTYGCVSLLNDEMEELYELVPAGTPVLIRDDEVPFVVGPARETILVRREGSPEKPEKRVEVAAAESAKAEKREEIAAAKPEERDDVAATEPRKPEAREEAVVAPPTKPEVREAVTAEPAEPERREEAGPGKREKRAEVAAADVAKPKKREVIADAKAPKRETRDDVTTPEPAGKEREQVAAAAPAERQEREQVVEVAPRRGLFAVILDMFGDGE